jgi:hypothetical protein
MTRRGFTPSETDNSIDYLIERGILQGTPDGVQLKQV